jgi:hypothetical protein
MCYNLSLGLATNARACKSVGQEGSSRVTSHAPKSAKEFEGMNPHILKWTFILGVKIPNGLSNIQRVIEGVKTQWIKAFFISLERSWNIDIWNGLAWAIWISKTQVMARRKANWRAPESRGETKLKVSQSQVAESRLGSTLPASNSRKG